MKKINLFKILKTKSGNSFLFMPYLVTFGITMLYIAMEMGTAYVRQIEVQSVTDAVARAGVYAGMRGSGVNYYLENDHVYINLDDATALQVAELVFKKNVGKDGVISSIKTSASDMNKGQYLIKDIEYCNPQNRIAKTKKIPIWNKTNGETGKGNFHWTEVSNLKSNSEVMSTGNFFVTIEGEYHTLIADVIIGKPTISIDGFASALATATKK